MKVDNKSYELTIKVLEPFGDSNDVSRQAVIDAHGGMENLRKVAWTWAYHHNLFSIPESDVIVAYAAAVDLGFRIGHKQEMPKG